jgi:hypothetical protein
MRRFERGAPWLKIPDHDFYEGPIHGVVMNDVCAYKLDAENWCLMSRWAHEQIEEKKEE